MDHLKPVASVFVCLVEAGKALRQCRHWRPSGGGCGPVGPMRMLSAVVGACAHAHI